MHSFVVAIVIGAENHLLVYPLKWCNQLLHYIQLLTMKKHIVALCKALSVKQMHCSRR
jgi:hypothetical protein